MNKKEDTLTDLALEISGTKHNSVDIRGFFATEITLENGYAITLGVRADDLDSGKKTKAAARALSDALACALSATEGNRKNSENTPCIALVGNGRSVTDDACKLNSKARDKTRSISPGGGDISKKASQRVSVICLGNGAFTADSLGALCAPSIIATRHLKEENPEIFSALGGTEISVISAGVTANSGITALEIAKMCRDTLGAQLIITVDALKAASADNLCRVIQITQGVTPGSGVGCDRPHISKKTLGVPVISIGVPTVISHSIAPASRLLVTPVDSDLAIKRFARVIAEAINLTLLGTFYD